MPDNVDAESTKSEGTVASTDSDVPLKPTNELDKRVRDIKQLTPYRYFISHSYLLI